MQTKCGVIFPPTSRRNPSSKSWNCQPSTPWVKKSSQPRNSTYLHSSQKETYRISGREQRRDCEQKYLFYFVREQLSRCPAECRSTQMQMLLAPPPEVPRFLRRWRHVFILTPCPCSPQRSSFFLLYEPGNGKNGVVLCFVFPTVRLQQRRHGQI